MTENDDTVWWSNHFKDQDIAELNNEITLLKEALVLAGKVLEYASFPTIGNKAWDEYQEALKRLDV